MLRIVNHGVNFVRDNKKVIKETIVMVGTVVAIKIVIGVIALGIGAAVAAARSQAGTPELNDTFSTIE